MSSTCSWYYSFEKHQCTHPNCENEARYACLTHGYEGFVCAPHGGWHKAQWLDHKDGDTSPSAVQQAA